MKIYIIDTNIVFSTAMNTESRIGQFLMQTAPEQVEFYAPTYLKVEIERHFPKLVKLSRLPEGSVREIIDLVYKRINFIDDAQIPIKTYSESAKLVRGVDEFDVQFVALTKHMDEILWTGDRKLYRHLLKMGFDQVVTFEDIQEELK
jgi:predicted nucleic acid-binding protein